MGRAFYDWKYHTRKIEDFGDRHCSPEESDQNYDGDSDDCSTVVSSVGSDMDRNPESNHLKRREKDIHDDSAEVRRDAELRPTDNETVMVNSKTKLVEWMVSF